MTSSFARPIRYGMIGGGRNALIGSIHRIAAKMDGNFELVAGALSSEAERAKASAADLGLSPERGYATYEEMANAESGRPDGIEAVVICTPNHVHAGPAISFLNAGVHVICDKPLTATLEEAEELHRIVKASDKVFVLTHNYTGYPMVREARSRVQSGELGEIRLVQVEYPQDWLAKPLENTDHKQADWRTDPARSGPGGCVADIGTHAFHLARFVSGLRVDRISAELTSFVPGRLLDDNVHAMLKFENGARGMLWASQVAPGHENGLRVRIYGEKAGLEWVQADPNYLWLAELDQPRKQITRGGHGSGADAAKYIRVPAGHPEGYFEAFATIYTEAAAAIRACDAGESIPDDLLQPGIEDGLEGMRFIYACLESSRKNSAWVDLEN
ncbi:MAG: Gfo/Idh/MocA family oxidoreductase [Albidovulum sp.]|nr:Gfo/Idh/MocA family oxidoreductase [Albidovulum sp.]